LHPVQQVLSDALLKSQQIVHDVTTSDREKLRPAPHMPCGNDIRWATLMKHIVALTYISLFSISTLTACNTMAGAGKDIQKVGEKLEDKAQDCKDGKC